MDWLSSERTPNLAEPCGPQFEFLFQLLSEWGIVCISRVSASRAPDNQLGGEEGEAQRPAGVPRIRAVNNSSQPLCIVSRALNFQRQAELFTSVHIR
jgi:hypothetical protein